MKHTRLGALALGALILVGALPKVEAQVTVSFDLFYDSLDPYGQWVDVGDYGYCWHPRGVDNDWSPYSDGYWAYTDAGWTWVSYEEWGWATYHYGRWVRVVGYGWVWRPGYEWAPAWVSWRYGGDYVGWAPLPPEARFRRDTGLSVWVDTRYDIGPSYYNFVEVRSFGKPALRPVILDRRRNVTIIENTRNITNITVHNNHIFNGGPSYREISRRSADRIETLELKRTADIDSIRSRRNERFTRKEGNRLIVAAPEVRAPEGEDIKPRKIERKFESPKVDKGWARLENDEKRREVREKMKAQTAEASERSARRVTEEDLEPVEATMKSEGPAKASENVDARARRAAAETGSTESKAEERKNAGRRRETRESGGRAEAQAESRTEGRAEAQEAASPEVKLKEQKTAKSEPRAKEREKSQEPQTSSREARAEAARQQAAEERQAERSRAREALAREEAEQEQQRENVRQRAREAQAQAERRRSQREEQPQREMERARPELQQVQPQREGPQQPEAMREPQVAPEQPQENAGGGKGKGKGKKGKNKDE